MRKIDRSGATWKTFAYTLLPEVDNANVVLTINKLIIFDRLTSRLSIIYLVYDFTFMFSAIKFA